MRERRRVPRGGMPDGGVLLVPGMAWRPLSGCTRHIAARLGQQAMQPDIPRTCDE